MEIPVELKVAALDKGRRLILSSAIKAKDKKSKILLRKEGQRLIDEILKYEMDHDYEPDINWASLKEELAATKED